MQRAAALAKELAMSIGKEGTPLHYSTCMPSQPRAHYTPSHPKQLYITLNQFSHLCDVVGVLWNVQYLPLHPTSVMPVNIILFYRTAHTEGRAVIGHKGFLSLLPA